MDTVKSKNIAILALTVQGAELGRRIKAQLGEGDLFLPEKLEAADTEELVFQSSLRETVAAVFQEYQFLVLIMATGIAVRLIAPLIQDKHSDPGVVVIDDLGIHAISLLSGHAGGANELTQRIAALIGAERVITTASDVNGAISADLLGKEFGWEIEDATYLTRVSASLVNGEKVGLFQDAGEPLEKVIKKWPANLCRFSSLEELSEGQPQAALIITDRILGADIMTKLPQYTLIYRPETLVVGIGCNRGTGTDLLEAALKSVLSHNNLSLKSLKNLATIDIKKDEIGLSELAQKYNLKLDYFDKEALLSVSGAAPSKTVLKYVGTPNVCEAAALLSSRRTLIAPKTSYQRAVTIAVARANCEITGRPTRGQVYIIGTGPGRLEQMTKSAREALAESDVIIGYSSYVKLIQPLLQGKEVISTGMGGEIERAQIGLKLASQGRTVAIISSGDAGVYGMAGTIGELLQKGWSNQIEITVIPGIPALAASAALLGAPLTGDFACISLSDHLVGWEKIRERLDCAARSDFVIVLYNPKSHQRPHQLTEAREIILRHRPLSTVVGIATNAYRDDQQIVVTDLEHLPECEVNMNTTVVVGNSATFKVDQWMVTPRGYLKKYGK